MAIVRERIIPNFNHPGAYRQYAGWDRCYPPELDQRLLPDFSTDAPLMSDYAPIGIDVLVAQHGAEAKKLHEVIARHLVPHCGPDLCSRLGYFEAARDGERTKGKGEIMGYYPGSISDPSNSPSVAAYCNMQWFSRRPDWRSGRILVYDSHSSPFRGLTFCRVGNRALKASIAGTYHLGFRNCVVFSDPFTEAVPNGAILETPVLGTRHEERVAFAMYQRLRRLAKFTLGELIDDYEIIQDRMTFYRRGHAYVKHPDGTMIDPKILQGLEAIPPGKPFEPLYMEPWLREALNIPEKAKLLYETSVHNNLSPEMPDELGYAVIGGKCVARRQTVAVWFYEIPKPRPEGQWAISDDG